MSWPLQTQMTALWKAAGTGGQAPVPGKKTAVENPLAQPKPQTAKNELLQLAHGAKEVDFVSFGPYPWNICNVPSIMKKLEGKA